MRTFPVLTGAFTISAHRRVALAATFGNGIFAYGGGETVKLSEAALQKTNQEIDAQGYAIIHDSDLEKLSKAARAEYVNYLLSSRIHPSRMPFDFRGLVHEPWRKLAIGSHIGLGDPYAQNLQSTYFAPEDSNFPSLSAIFRKMLGVRDQLMGLFQGFGNDPDRDGFWNACRIHHYPRGGGFMAMHRDTHFPNIIDEQLGKPFYQISVLLSRKLSHFVSGGGFVIDSQGKKIDLESRAGFGTMVIFDGRTPHGVDDVDLDQLIDFSKADGRLAAFVNLYKVL